MADLNDDIKKYLNGELTPAEMHALEKRALNDPFLEDALEGAGQLGPEAFNSDLSNLKSSLQNRISKKTEKVVPLWGWTMRIAAGLAFIAVSTFVIIQLTDNKNDGDLAQQKESPNLMKEEAVTSDSTLLRRDAAGAGVEPAKPQSPQATEEQKENKGGELAQAKPKAEDGPPPPTIAEEQALAEVATADEQITTTTEGVSKDSEAIAKQETEKESVESKKVDADKAVRKEVDDNDRQRVAANQPATAPARAFGAESKVSKVITGRVVSVDGIGLPGVNVMLKNSNIGTVTDGSGNYRITTTEENPDLVFSFIGFTSAEVVTGDKSQVDVQLTEDVSQLSEVVVVGYGAEKSDETMETVELASPAGGRRAFKQYLEKNLRYPEQALASGVEGKVTIQFTVESSGLLSDFKVIKGIGHGCEQEVIRLVQQGPKWYPTRKNTESLRDRVKVRMKFTLPKK